MIVDGKCSISRSQKVLCQCLIFWNSNNEKFCIWFLHENNTIINKRFTTCIRTDFKISKFEFLTVCFCHVTYAFQSESTLYSWVNVKELLARNRRAIWSLSDCNWTRNHSHLVRKQTLNQGTPWLFWICICLPSLKSSN